MFSRYFVVLFQRPGAEKCPEKILEMDFGSAVHDQHLFCCLTRGLKEALDKKCWILSDQVKKLLERCLLPEISIIKAQDMEFSSRMMVKHNKSIKLLISPVSQWAGSVHVDVKDTDIRHVSKYTTTFKKLSLPCQYHSFRIDRVLRACRHFQVSEK